MAPQVMEVNLAKTLPNSHRVPQSDGPQAAGFQELFFLLVSSLAPGACSLPPT